MTTVFAILNYETIGLLNLLTQVPVVSVIDGLELALKLKRRIRLRGGRVSVNKIFAFSYLSIKLIKHQVILVILLILGLW